MVFGKPQITNLLYLRFGHTTNQFNLFMVLGKPKIVLFMVFSHPQIVRQHLAPRRQHLAPRRLARHPAHRRRAQHLAPRRQHLAPRRPALHLAPRRQHLAFNAINTMLYIVLSCLPTNLFCAI